MRAEFDVKLTEKDLYSFNIYQTYTGSQGIISILIAIIVWVMGGVCFSRGQIPYGIMYLAGGLVILAYIPLSLKTKVKLTMKTNDALSKPLHYDVSENSISVSQGEETAELAWDRIYKLVANEKRILVYSSRVNAYIIPAEQIGSEYDSFISIAKSKLEKYRLKVK